jgi:hypothetical protein
LLHLHVVAIECRIVVAIVALFGLIVPVQTGGTAAATAAHEHTQNHGVGGITVLAESSLAT